MDSSTSNRITHIVVFPWLAFGHLLPFLELSKALATRGYRITFISTPKNIQRLPKIPPQISHLIHFLSFPLPPTTPGLPEGAEATSDVLPATVQYLKIALDTLQFPVTRYLESANPKPDWIIQDFCYHWLPSVASKLEIPCVFFNIFLTVTFTPLLDYMSENKEGPITPERLMEPPKKIKYPTKIACRELEARQMIGYFFSENESKISDYARVEATLRGCQAVAVRTCYELESEWLDLAQELYKKPVIPVGFLLPDDHGQEDDGSDITQWLDKQKEKSVVYVAFGSEAMLSDEFLHELAHGIELSELPFLWVLRLPATEASNAKVLPDGFEERTKRLGKVVKSWIPQKKILAHRSIGGFLTHCGASSFFESLQFALPLILFPITPEQALNSRLMEEKNVGLEIQKNEFDGSFSREEVARTLKCVMGEEDGEKFRVRAEEMKKTLIDKARHERYIDELVQYLKNNHRRSGS